MTAPTPNAMPAVSAPPAAPATPEVPAAAPAAPAAPVAPVAPAVPAAPAPAPAAAAPAPPAAPAPVPVPPWGADDAAYDAPTAAKLIANLRADNDSLKGKLAAAPAAAPAPAPAAPAEPTVDADALVADMAAWRTEAVSAKTIAKASELFGDPVAAMALAGIGDGSAFVEGNVVDEAKVDAALAQVAEKHPLLLKQQGPNGFKPNRGQAGAGAVPVTTAQIAANAESQQDWKTAGAAKANQLLQLHSQS